MIFDAREVKLYDR